MNEIVSYVQPENSNSIYACGFKTRNGEDIEFTLASAMKVDERGKVNFLYVWDYQAADSDFSNED